MKPAYLTATVRVGGRRLTAEYRLHRGHDAPHVGADHPDFMAPGVPDRVEVVRVLMGRVDVTETLEADSMQAIEYQIVRGRITGGAPSRQPAAGVSTSFTPSPVSFHSDKALAIGTRVLAAKERRVRDERQQHKLEGI